MLARLAPLVALALAGGCAAVGPDYRAPVAAAPAAGGFAETAGTRAVAPNTPVEGAWWRLYRDPVLDGLVEDALAANMDVRVAVANIAVARGALRGTRSQLLPSTDLSATAGYGRTAAAGGFGPVSSGVLDAGFSVAYEVDLFGRVRRDVEAATADVETQAALLDATRITIAAETTRAYADACSFAEQRRVAERTVGLLQRSLDLTLRTLEAGRGTRLDVEQARALVEQQRATIPVFEAQRAASLYALAYLTGRAPGELPEQTRACAVTPRLAQPIPVGDGSTLLARRPDVRAAERRLAADTARIGVQTADLYPRIGLGGSVGLTGTSFGGFFSGDAFNYSVGPFLSFSFPNREVVRGRILAAEGGAAASLARFDDAVLSALRETETAISTLGRELERRQSLARARDAAAKAAELSRLRFREGVDSFLNVLDADRTLAGAEAQLAQSDQFIAENQINLFRALGGGWEGLGEPAGPPVYDPAAERRVVSAGTPGR